MFKNWDNGSEVVIIGTIRVRRTGEGRRQVHIQENDHRREDGKQHENRSFFCRGCGLFWWFYCNRRVVRFLLTSCISDSSARTYKLRRRSRRTAGKTQQHTVKTGENATEREKKETHKKLCIFIKCWDMCFFACYVGRKNVKFCNGSMPHFPHDSEILKKQVQSTDRKRERQARKIMR